MDKDIFKGIKFAFGIFLFFGILFGVAFAVGFHTPNEIISGNFANDYSFNGSLDFTNATITGLSSIPSGFVGSFNLASCPTGWSTSDGTAGTVDLRGKFVRGLDLGAGVDPSRTLGTYQADDLKSHTHTMTNIPSNPIGSDGPIDTSNFASVNDRTYITATSSATGGTETRPKNVALIYCQKN